LLSEDSTLGNSSIGGGRFVQRLGLVGGGIGGSVNNLPKFTEPSKTVVFKDTPTLSSLEEFIDSLKISSAPAHATAIVPMSSFRNVLPTPTSKSNAMHPLICGDCSGLKPNSKQNMVRIHSEALNKNFSTILTYPNVSSSFSDTLNPDLERDSFFKLQSKRRTMASALEALESAVFLLDSVNLDASNSTTIHATCSSKIFPETKLAVVTSPLLTNKTQSQLKYVCSFVEPQSKVKLVPQYPAQPTLQGVAMTSLYHDPVQNFTKPSYLKGSLDSHSSAMNLNPSLLSSAISNFQNGTNVGNSSLKIFTTNSSDNNSGSAIVLSQSRPFTFPFVQDFTVSQENRSDSFKNKQDFLELCERDFVDDWKLSDEIELENRVKRQAGDIQVNKKV